jgi:hypothetical protein
MIPANDDVSTTRLTVLLYLLTDPSTFFVPFTAGSIRSFCIKDEASTPKIRCEDTTSRLQCFRRYIFRKALQ